MISEAHFVLLIPLHWFACVDYIHIYILVIELHYSTCLGIPYKVLFEISSL